MRLLLATTLLHRTGPLDPYAPRGDGPLRLTAVTAGARRFWPALPRLLTGRYSAAMTADRAISAADANGSGSPASPATCSTASASTPTRRGRSRSSPVLRFASSADELGFDPHPHLGAEPRRSADARRLCARLSGTERRGDRRRPPRRADGRPGPLDAAVDAEPGDEKARPAAVAAGAGGDARRRVPRPAAERDGAAVAGDRADLPEGRARAARQPAGRLHRRPHRDRPAPGAGARRHGGALAALPAAVGRTDVERGGDRGAARVRGVPARGRDGGDAAQLADLSRHRPVDLVAGRPRRGAGRRRAAGAAAGADPRLAPRGPAPDDAAQGPGLGDRRPALGGQAAEGDGARRPCRRADLGPDAPAQAGDPPPGHQQGGAHGAAGAAARDHGRGRLLRQPVPAAHAAPRGAGDGVPAGPGGELPLEVAARLAGGGGARKRLLVADRGDRRGRRPGRAARRRDRAAAVGFDPLRGRGLQPRRCPPRARPGLVRDSGPGPDGARRSLRRRQDDAARPRGRPAAARRAAGS